MKALTGYKVRSLPIGAEVPTCDNSGAKIVKIIAVKGIGTVRRRLASAGVGDIVKASVIKGRPDMRRQVVMAVIVRQRKEYKRADGTRIKFEDNAVVVLKDDKGNPKGTIFKGAVAKEAAERFPGISKVANIVV
jgi:large subunit ribosomal protein L14